MTKPDISTILRREIPNFRTRKGFFPVNSLEGKRNLKRNFRIESDGSVTECAYLWVPNQRLRELIICIHFLRNYVRRVYQHDVGVKFIRRDAPWDFGIQTSAGDNFNLEIIAIADSERLFRTNKQEERAAEIAHLKTISLKVLRQLNYYFPDEHIATLISQYEQQGLDSDAHIQNPWFEKPSMFFNRLPITELKLSELIREAVSLKVSKSHTDKNSTILVIDNRTSGFDIDDYYEACSQLEKFLATTPFREIWFYTGYYSDDDGGNAEWALSILFAPATTLAKYDTAAVQEGWVPDENGIVYGRNFG